MVSVNKHQTATGSPKSNTVVEGILLYFRNALSSGRFSGGDRLPSEYDLIKELGVSRNSLREAMKILEAIGVVDIRRGDGTYICSQIKPNFIDSVAYSVLLESSSAQELIEFRRTLDEDVLRLAIAKCDQKDIDTLEGLIDAMRSSFERGDIAEAAGLDVQFHQYLAKCTQNRFLERMVLGVYGLFEVSIEKNIRTEELFASADRHHTAIVECIKSRDTAAVSSVVEQSLSSWQRDIKSKIAAQ